MTSAKRRPCSDQSLARNDPMYGTASAGLSWALLELSGAWGHSAFLHSAAIIDPDLGRAIARRFEQRVADRRDTSPRPPFRHRDGAGLSHSPVRAARHFTAGRSAILESIWILRSMVPTANCPLIRSSRSVRTASTINAALFGDVARPRRSQRNTPS